MDSKEKKDQKKTLFVEIFTNGHFRNLSRFAIRYLF